MCAIVPLFPHSLQFGSLTRPHWCRFTGDGSVSYTDLSRNEIPNWSFLHSSVRVNCRSGRSHLIKAPCFISSVDLAFLWSSSVRRTSAWTMVRPSAADAFDHCRKWDIPTPCHLVFVFPMMSRMCSILSAWSTDVFAYHFLPFLVWIPAPAILLSAESCNFITKRHLATLIFHHRGYWQA